MTSNDFAALLLAALLLPLLPIPLQPSALICLVFAAVLISCHAVVCEHFRLIDARPGVRRWSVLQCGHHVAWRAALLTTLVLLAFAVSTWRLASTLETQLPPSWEGRDLELVGYIDSLIEQDARLHRFYVRGIIKNHEVQNAAREQAGRVRLSWRGQGDTEGAALRPGQCWRFQVRLRRPRGLSNRGGFDYQAWLLSRGVVASGYVKEAVACPDSDKAIFAGVRQRLSDHIDTVAATTRWRALFKALLLGDKRAITPEQWQTFRLSGTVHLMAISGLHVGMLAALAFAVCKRCFTPLGMVMRPEWPQWFIVIGTLTCAGAYAALAGLSVPTQRAALALGGMMLLFQLGRRVQALTWLLWLASLFVLVNPIQATQPGFVLSFAAVAALLLAFSGRYESRRAPWHRFASVLRAQWVVWVALLPLQAFLHLPVATSAPLFNLLAVPLVGLVILPMLLIALCVSLVSSSLSAPFWALAALGFDVLFVVQEQMEQVLPQSLLLLHLRVLPRDVLLLLGSFWLMARTRSRALGVLGGSLFFLILTNAVARPSPEFRITVMDVGQGLSVVVSSPGETLVYDVGAQYSSKFSMAANVVMPYLDTYVSGALIGLVLSHADNDHAGDAESLLHRYGNVSVYSGEAEELAALGAIPCTQESTLPMMQGLEIDILWPPADYDAEDANNRSCVLVLKYKNRVIVLAGDIEREVEQALLRAGTLPQSVDLLIAPHHGSRTSSSAAFVRQLRPTHVVFSAGHNNRYRHPAEDVVQRYREVNSHVWHTAHHGGIEFTLEHGQWRARAERCANLRAWYHTEGFCETTPIRYDSRGSEGAEE